MMKAMRPIAEIISPVGMRDAATLRTIGVLKERASGGSAAQGGLAAYPANGAFPCKAGILQLRANASMRSPINEAARPSDFACERASQQRREAEPRAPMHVLSLAIRCSLYAVHCQKN